MKAAGVQEAIVSSFRIRSIVGVIMLAAIIPVARAQSSGAPRLKAATDGTAGHLVKFDANGNASDALTVEGSNGYLGIGTTTPLQPLHIWGNIGGNSAVRAEIDNANASGFADIFVFNSVGKYNGLQIGGPTTSGTQF